MNRIIFFATNNSMGIYKLFNSKKKRIFYEQRSNTYDNKRRSMGRA